MSYVVRGDGVNYKNKHLLINIFICLLETKFYIRKNTAPPPVISFPLVLPKDFPYSGIIRHVNKRVPVAKPDKIFPGWHSTARLLGIWLTVLILSGCRTPVSEYRPRNSTEAAILSLLVDFQEAKNDRDIHRFLLLLHPDGQFTYACGVMVSKATLAAKLPDFWKGIDHKKLTTVPLAHECLNGDYYTSGILKDPEITVSGDRARVKVCFTRKWWSGMELFFHLVREGDRWRITRTWWGPT